MSWRAQGFRAWLLQRLTAVYMAFFLVWLLTYLALYPPANFEAWQAVAGSVVGLMTFSLFFIALLLHSWVGVRDIVIDYVHYAAARLIVLNLLMLFLISMSVWITYILLSLVEL